MFTLVPDSPGGTARVAPESNDAAGVELGRADRVEEGHRFIHRGGGDDEGSEKHDAVSPPCMRQMRRTKCFQTYCKCCPYRLPKLVCFKYCIFALGVLTLLLLITVIVLSVVLDSTLANLVAAGRSHGMMQSLAMVQTLPVAKDWNSYLDCIARPEQCKLCEHPKTVFMQPPQDTRVALVGPRGTGGTWARQLIETGTRIRTGTDDCWVSHQFGMPWKDAPFISECAGPFFFSHEVAVRFFNWEHLHMYPGYAPTHVIVMTRNPFDSILSAYAFFTYCRGVHSAYCENRGAKSTDFTNYEDWEQFAVDRAREWVQFMNEANTSSLPKLWVTYEDLARHRMETMRDTLEFLRAAVPNLPTTSAALTCAMADADTSTKRTSSVFSADVFTPRLVERVCTIVRPRWMPEKWGNTCAPPPRPGTAARAGT